MPDHVAHVIGARPNFIKAAPVIAAIGRRPIPQRVVHTGQHYDERMSDVFFHELGLPVPDVNLGVGSGTHAEQTAAAMIGLEREFATDRPSLVMLYGDEQHPRREPRGGQARDRERARRGRTAFVRPLDARGDQPAGQRPPGGAPVHDQPRGAADHLAAMGIDARRIHFVGNPMIDTLLAHRERFDDPPSAGAWAWTASAMAS